MDQRGIKRRISAEKFEYYSEKLTNTVPLSTAVGLSLIAFLGIIDLEGRIIFTDSEDGLIQGFAQIPGTVLGDRHMCSVIFAGLVNKRLHTGIRNQFCRFGKVYDITDLRKDSHSCYVRDTGNGNDRRV